MENKKQFENPNAEIIIFESEDIITASFEEDDNETPFVPAKP